MWQEIFIQTLQHLKQDPQDLVVLPKVGWEILGEIPRETEARVAREALIQDSAALAVWLGNQLTMLTGNVPSSRNLRNCMRGFLKVLGIHEGVGVTWE